MLKNESEAKIMANTNSAYRILGTVWETATSQVGYAVIDTEEKLPQVRLVTTAQAIAFAQNTGFENADIENGALVITECSVNRLPKYDTKGNVFENAGYMIVARLTDNNGITRGFKIVSHKGEVLHVAYGTLVGQAETNVISLINAKLRPNNSGTNGGVAIVSAIRGEFKEVVIAPKEPAKETPVNAFASSDKYATRANSKGYHENFLNKVISRVATQYLIMGKKAFPKKKDIQSKRFKIYLNEFIRVKYPEFEGLMKQNLHWGYTIPALLEYMKNPAIGYETSGKIYSSEIEVTRSINLIRDLGAYRATNHKLTTEERYEHYGLGVVPDAVIKFVEGLGDENAVDIVIMLQAVNKVYVGDVYHLDKLNRVLRKPDLSAGVNNITIRAHINKLRNAFADAESGKLAKDISKKRYVTSELDYSTLEGVESLGITLEESQVGLRVPSPIYKDITSVRHNGTVGGTLLRYAYEGLTLSEEAKSELSNLVNCYGDLKILGELVHLNKYTEEYRGLEDANLLEGNKFANGYLRLVNFYTYILAVHNPSFATKVVDLLGIDGILDFSIDDVDQPTNLSDKLFYNSGLRFSTKAELLVGKSWGGAKTNIVPKNTHAGYMETVNNAGAKLVSKFTPRINGTLPLRYQRYW